MKRISLLAVMSSMLVSGMTTQILAQDCCGSNWSDCCSTSLCDGRFKVGAEWLYWKGEQDDLSLVLTHSGTTNTTSPDLLTRKTCFVEPNFKYTNGFRVNLGYELPCNCWEANVIYTNLPIHASSSLLTAVPSTPNGNGGGPFTLIEPNPVVAIFRQLSDLFANIGNVNQSFNGGPSYQTFEQKWTLTFNQIDVDIAKTISCNDCISIKPHAGFRAIWYTDTQKATFTGALPNGGRLGAPTHAFTSDVDLKNTLKGYGIEAGLWGTWEIGCGLSLLGHFGGSILYAKYRLCEEIATEVTTTTTVENPVVTVNNYTSDFHDNLHTATPGVDYFLGLQFADDMCDMSFVIRVGWEQHLYFDTNKIFQAGNLSTQGLSLGLEVGF